MSRRSLPARRIQGTHDPIVNVLRDGIHKTAMHIDFLTQRQGPTRVYIDGEGWMRTERPDGYGCRKHPLPMKDCIGTFQRRAWVRDPASGKVVANANFDIDAVRESLADRVKEIRSAA